MNNLLLKRLKEKINKEIKSVLINCDIPISRKMLEYQMGLPTVGSLEEEVPKGQDEKEQGKRFRPILCLLSCISLNGDYKKALPAAVAIELIHNFSLIHDDIQDEDEYRRGRMTVWKKFSKNQAINSGDAMHTLSNIALLKLFKMNLSPDVINSVLSVVNSACFQMCEGQMMDIDFEKRTDAGISEYLKMIQKKTAKLIESAPFAGALIATRNQKIINCYRNFGLNVGMAFQIFNDISGFGDSSRIKFAHFQSDLAKNKKTLPLILTFKNLKSKQNKKMSVKEIFSLIQNSGAIQLSRKTGEEYLERAIVELDKTGIRNPAQELLKEYIWRINANCIYGNA